MRLCLLRVLYKSYPFVGSLDSDSCDFCWCSAPKSFVWAHVVVENLIARKNRAVVSFEVASYLFTGTDFLIEPFHFVVVMISR